MPHRTNNPLGRLFSQHSEAAAEDQVIDSGLAQTTTGLNQKRGQWIAWLTERKLLPLQFQVAAGARPLPPPASRSEV